MARDLDSKEKGCGGYSEEFWSSLSIIHSPLADPIDQLIELMKFEIIQREEEGYDMDSAREVFRNLIKEKSYSKILEFYSSLDGYPMRRGFQYSEPVDYGSIVSESPGGSMVFDVELSNDMLYDRIYGGWLGRCIGCMLGKPVEGLTHEMISRWLELAGGYSLKDYFPDVELESSEIPQWLSVRLENLRRHYREKGYGVLRGQVDRAVRDDDIDYTILNLHIAKIYGHGFTTMDIAETWLSMLPYCQVYTAERIAYRNLVNGILPPKTATYTNPFREWIGAQIRADLWGYIAPGLPAVAAEFAYRDASLSHVKNGVYGEMFVSAMISAAFATDDVYDVVRAGLSVIPQRSRLAEAIRDVVSWSRESRDYWETFRKIVGKYGCYNPIHTIVNAAIVVASLLHGNGDFEKTVTLAVLSGFDTDCNGATAGSIVGVMMGSNKLPKGWSIQLNDRVESYIAGYNNARISELAKQTLEIAKRIRSTYSRG